MFARRFQGSGFAATIYPGVYLTHTYGLKVGRGFSPNSGALIDARGAIDIGDHVMVGYYVADYQIVGGVPARVIGARK